MLSKIDEFFLGKDHPFRYSFETVFALKDHERKSIMWRLQDIWGWKGFYIGLGSTCIGSIIYNGRFPLTIGNIIGYGLLTFANSLLGGAIGSCIGVLSSLGRGMVNGLILPKDLNMSGIPINSNQGVYGSTSREYNPYQTTQSYVTPYESTIAYATHQEFLRSRPWHGY